MRDSAWKRWISSESPVLKYFKRCAGLTIQREYSDKNDKQYSVTIANNSVMMAGVSAYLSGGYAQQANAEQTWKQTKIKGYRTVIEYSEGSGYTLSVPTHYHLP